MRLGLRARLTLVSVLLVAVFGLVSGLWLYHEVRQQLQHDLHLPPAEVARALWQLKAFMAGAGLLGLVASVFMSLLASHLADLDLAALLRQTRAAVGEPAHPVPDPSSATGIHRLSANLERAVAELAAERNRMQQVLTAMRDGLMALDASGRITLLNPAAGRLLELDERALGRPLSEAAPLPELLRLASEAMAGASVSTDLELIRPTGKRQLLVTANPQGDGGTVLALRDVTELRHLETVRRDFVANVSHELRTPVSAVRASAEALLDGALEEPALGQSLVEAILRNAERLTALINDLLSLSRLEAGSYEFKPESVDVAALARRVRDAMSVRATAHRQQVRIEVPAALRVRADGRALEQILTNLVDNALKYTPPGAVVEVRGAVEDGRVRLEVRDDGPGVPPQHRSRIFERFYRVDPGRSRDVGGTGLGLAIVKHLAEAMGGAVGYQAASPRGAIFWIALPQA